MSVNPVNWWEIASTDGERTATFLREVFDWDLQYSEKSGIWVLPLDDIARSRFEGGGIFTLKKDLQPHVTVYIEVDDVDEKAEKVVKAGGTIYEGPRYIAEVDCKICLFKEPTGLILAMLESRK